MGEHHRFEVADHNRCVHEAVVRLDACRLLIEGCEAVDPATNAAVNNAKRAIKDALVVLARMQDKTPIDPI